MNQGKLDMVKQEMARVNIDILAISELKWTGMDCFNSDDHFIYYCGQESLKRNGVGIIINKRLQMQYLDAISKTTKLYLFVSKANHSISVIQAYTPTSNAKEAEAEQFYEDLQDLLELTPKKDVLVKKYLE